MNQRLFSEKGKNHKSIFQMNVNYKTFNIKYPIIQAGMIWVNGHKLQVHAGGLVDTGSIPSTAMTFRNVKEKLKPLGKCSNVVPNIEEIMKIIVEEGENRFYFGRESKNVDSY
jgi:hypothetical protein